MSTKTIEIKDLANWSIPKQVDTRNGPRMLRKATPTDAFWQAWRSSKQALKDTGVSVSKRNGSWEACWWLPLGEEEQRQEQQAQEASRATNADIEVPAPDGCEYLPYQRAGIAYALEREGTLIGDEMGLGKTIQAIGAVNSTPGCGNVLIICPASLRLNWERELRKWATDPRLQNIAVVTGGKASDWPKNTNVVIVNYDVLHKHRERIDQTIWDWLIVDEVHYAKNPSAKRTRALFGWRTKKGEVKQTPIKARRRMFLTGTPIVNRPIELWPIVEALDPTDLGRSFFGFAKQYCDAKNNGYGWDFSGASNLDKLQTKLRRKFMVRRLKQDVLKELPAKIRQVVELPANGAASAVAEERRTFDSHRAYIEELEQRLAETERDDPLHAELTEQLGKAKQVAFTEVSKARHAVGLAKVSAVVEHVENAGHPVVVFAWHQDVVDGICEALGDRAVKLTGQTPMDERQRMVDDFQAGKADVFVGNIKAAGVGLTLTRASHVLFAELDWVPGNLTQAEDRCHRIGQTDSVLVQHLVFEDSVDAYMVEKLIAKQDVIHRTLDAEPGQPEAPADCKTEVEVRERVEQKAIDVEVEEPMPPEQAKAVHECLRMLAGCCDGARTRDNAGFNGTDSAFGKSLAYQEELTDRQARSALRMLPKYHRQLPADLLVMAKGE